MVINPSPETWLLQHFSQDYVVMVDHPHVRQTGQTDRQTDSFQAVRN